MKYLYIKGGYSEGRQPFAWFYTILALTPFVLLRKISRNVIPKVVIRDVEAEVEKVEAVLFLWKRKREKSTASAST